MIYWPSPMEALSEFHEKLGAPRALPSHWLTWCEAQVIDTDDYKEFKDVLTSIYCLAVGFLVGLGFAAGMGWCIALPL